MLRLFADTCPQLCSAVFDAVLPRTVYIIPISKP